MSETSYLVVQQYKSKRKKKEREKKKIIFFNFIKQKRTAALISWSTNIGLLTAMRTDCNLSYNRIAVMGRKGETDTSKTN